MCEDVPNLPFANVSVHGNFVACHLDTEPDNDPLDGFGNGFTLRHGGGES